MNKKEIIEIFKEKFPEFKFLIDEPMKNHTSFKIGGPVDILFIPKNIEQISKVLTLCKELDIDYFIMGNGSNLLVSDKGIRGVVIKISENLSDVRVEGNKIIAQSGILLSKLSRIALKHSLTGLEFASGIPGSLGGAITMNAGAYGGEMKDIVTLVRCIDGNGEIIEFTNEQMEFGYRSSIIDERELIVIEVEMELKKGNYEDIRSYMDELTQKRITKQPLNLPSAGSTFKRPKGYYAGKLIEDAGLKGLRFGDAQVSEKHSGFIVNLGNATCNDVLNLIKVIQKTVRDKFGVELKTEVKIIGEK
ncbi:UDP-N-acetylmuramate dehydrogenase [Caloranaerobacter azorensis]|uniref:UDP-N-acetylenolpyruvoylglucosamine reductase n=2 Tax=Caloranaerobacter azorensis TaxID=116090 RepID=A0A096CVW3_9FIRM|nr:UDP-N-acetylmuramate dehydrogenase [Caloranaerobacter azorensis]KGG80689.1 UDP-N-acetylenolpyruvoylglucosamine reductase [Caloranaerobacter azorensis H53214]QIB26890.1 UDP-N-acetylmuramate dehydrogenase [Caloranaerobacter azorensis]